MLYIVRHMLKRDGQEYVAGDEIAIPIFEEASELMRLGVIVPKYPELLDDEDGEKPKP